MTTTTFSLTCGDSDWTLFADGASYKLIGIQMDSEDEVYVAFADSSVGLTTDSAIYIGRETWSSNFTFELDAADKVFVRSKGGSAKVRGYKTTR